MTKIIVLADTHVAGPAHRLPGPLLRALEEADHIVHLGDFTGEAMVHLLESLGPLTAVHGNNDPPAIRERFPAEVRITINGHKLVLIHGHQGGPTAISAARAVAGTDVVLFGHSHQPLLTREGGRLLFNPGSPTQRRFAKERTYGWLTLGETIEAAIVAVRE